MLIRLRACGSPCPEESLRFCDSLSLFTLLRERLSAATGDDALLAMALEAFHTLESRRSLREGSSAHSEAQGPLGAREHDSHQPRGYAFSGFPSSSSHLRWCSSSLLPLSPFLQHERHVAAKHANARPVTRQCVSGDPIAEPLYDVFPPTGRRALGRDVAKLGPSASSASYRWCCSARLISSISSGAGGPEAERNRGPD